MSNDWPAGVVRPSDSMQPQPRTLMQDISTVQGVYLVGKGVLMYGFIRTVLMIANLALFFYLACLWFANHEGASSFIGWFVVLLLSIIPGRFIAEVGTPRYRRVVQQYQQPLQ